MKNSSKIYLSIIVCIYNGERTLKKTLDSLNNQNYSEKKYEIILIDDGSEDNSERICLNFIDKNKKKYPKIRYVKQKNKGLSSARNLGILLSKGQIVAFIDQDAVADNNWIKWISYEFELNQNVMVVGGKTCIINDNCWFSKFIYIIYYETYGDQIIITGTNMAYRKEIFDRVGGFYKAFKYFGDETTFLRKNILNKYIIKKTKKAIVYHEWPMSLKQWLNECVLKGKYGLWGNKVIQGKSKRPKISIKDKIRLFSILLIPSLVFTLIYPLLFCWILLLASLQLLHMLFFRRKSIYKILILYKFKAIYFIPYSIGIIYLGMLMTNFTYLIEWFKNERIDFNNSIDSTNLNIEEVKN